MKRRLIKVISIAITAVILLSSFPFVGFSEVAQATGKAAEEFSANTYIAGRLQILFDRLVYGDKPYFTTTGQGCGNTHCDDCALKAVCTTHPAIKDLGITYNDTTAYGSASFARFAYTVIFGEKLETINLYGNVSTQTVTQTIGRVASNDVGIIGSYDQMSEQSVCAIMKNGTAGDLIQARSSRGANHTMVFLKYDNEGVWVLHSIDFGDDTANYNRVVISMYTYAELMEKWDRVISLLRADESTYTTAYGKGEISHTTHTYTDEGGNNCVICGEAFVPTVSKAEAGVYKALTDAEVYYSPYRSKKIDGLTVGIGSFTEVVASVKNALGVTFYILAGTGYVCADDFKTDASGAPAFSMEQYPSAVWTYGEGCLIIGSVSAPSKITRVSGYIANAAGDVVQKQSIETSSAEVVFTSTAINRLTFGTLAEGNYVFLMTAITEGGVMGSFSTQFEVRKPLIKPTPATPSAPTLKEKTDTSVRLVQTDGYEYKLGDGAWQSSSLFTGLQPATVYEFYRRTAENDTYKPSEASAALSVKTDKSKVSAPSAPTLKDKTDTTITLYVHEGEEYSKDGGATWQSSGLYTGLTPGTNYRFIARVAATETSYASPVSAALIVRTEKSTVSAPAAPVLADRTDMSITVQTAEGVEYSINNGESWQSEGLFSGLTPGADYKIIARLAETETTFASPASTALNASTDRSILSPPEKPEMDVRTDKTITLKERSGQEFSIDGGKTWQTSGLFKGLEPGSEYTFVARYAESGVNYASGASAALTVKTDKGVPTAPSRPELNEVFGYRITIKTVDGLEYKIGEGAWQKSGVFEVQTYGEYRIYARRAETEKYYAGPSSGALVVTVNPLALTSDKAAVNEEKLIVGGVSIETTVGALWSFFPENEYLTVCLPDGSTAPSDAAVRTGMKLVLKSGKEYVLAVTGDASGDGEVNVFDLTKLKLEILSGEELSGAFFAAADVNGDGNVNVFDYVLIKNSILSGEKL